jgi:hypothetical protein
MSIQTFSLATVEKIRRFIQNALAVADTEQQSQTWASSEGEDELPEPESLDDLSGVFTFGGLSADEITSPNLRETQWFVSTVNPAAALLKMPGLQVKPGWRLTGYLYRMDKDGVGLIFAVPEALSTTAQLEKALAASGNIFQPPKPDGALSHMMDAIEGDRSPLSFMIASILRREFQEFGALAQRRNWSYHRLIETVPSQVQWQWQTDQPRDLSPKVKVLPNGQAGVEFFTCRVNKPFTIFRHLDQYPANQYSAKGADKAIAIIQR